MLPNFIKSAQFRLHFIVFLWGFTAILGKLITLDAHTLVWYRFSLTTVFLFIFLFFYRKERQRISRKLLFTLLSVGFLLALHWMFFFYSIKISNVSIALSCLSTSTLFTAIAEPLIYRRKVDWFEVLVGVVIVACMLLIFNAELHYKEGIFFGVLCAFLGSIFSVFNGKLYGKTSSGNIIFYEILGGTLFLTVLYICTGQIFNFNEISWSDFWLLVLLAGLFTAFPMFQSISLMKYISPFTLILTINLEPVYGIIFAYLIFGDSEYMSPIFYIASVVMLLAIVANGIVKARRKVKMNRAIGGAVRPSLFRFTRRKKK